MHIVHNSTQLVGLVRVCRDLQVSGKLIADRRASPCAIRRSEGDLQVRGDLQVPRS
jgi:hypothetical protein